MISTHILDTSIGIPAEGVFITLEKENNGAWQTLSQGTTNADGRLTFDCEKAPGNYRLLFKIESYYEKKKIESFFLDTPVHFKIKDTSRKYHVPLLLNPYGYSTYRGS
jgi:hydroxyisourate hydrolase